MSPRRRVEGPFFFVHLQKTAGTSLTSQMRDRFGAAAVYPDESDRGSGEAIEARAVLSVDHLRARWAARGDEIEVVTGHFPLCTAELLGARFRTFTLLREPVARTLSYLRHHRELSDGADARASLAEIYDDPFRFRSLVQNHMVKMFSLTTEEMDDGALTLVEFDEARLDRAKRQLATVDVVGVQEDYEGFCTDLRRTFGWRLGAPRRMNRSRPAELDAELVERIRADNALDVELYEHARRLVAQRRGERRWFSRRAGGGAGVGAAPPAAPR